MLTEGGFEYEAVIRVWQERQWILVDGSSSKGAPSAHRQANGWVIAIRMEAVRQVEGGRRMKTAQFGTDLGLAKTPACDQS